MNDSDVSFRNEMTEVSSSLRELVVELKRDREAAQVNQKRNDRRHDENQKSNDERYSQVMLQSKENAKAIVDLRLEISPIKGQADLIKQLSARVLGGLFSTAFIGALAMYFTLK